MMALSARDIDCFSVSGWQYILFYPVFVLFCLVLIVPPLLGIKSLFLKINYLLGIYFVHIWHVSITQSNVSLPL